MNDTGLNDVHPLNIAMIGQKRVPSREGGVEIVVEELSTRMADRGHHVTLYNRRGHHVGGKEFDVKHEKEYKGVRLKSVMTIDKKGLAAVSASFHAALCAALGRYDIVHFHAEGPCAMLWIPKIFGKRTIATIHGLDHQRAKWNAFARKCILFGEQTAAKHADEIIVLSRGVQDYFLKTYGRSTIYIPNGVSLPSLRDARCIEEKYGLKKNGYLLFLGRCVPEKGIQYLIEAFKNVKTDKKLIVAGSASNTDGFVAGLKRAASDDPRILFTGFVQGDLLEELYSNAYVYVLPSELEGMPLSLLEAMSYGNCCLVSDIPECADVVEDKAVTFCHGSIPDLTRQLQRLCSEPDLVEQYKKTAASYICGKYNWDDVVDQTLQVYYGKKGAQPE